MKRIFLFFVILIYTLCTIFFIGCNNNSSTPPDTPSHTCEASTNIVYRENNNKLSIGYACTTCNNVCQAQREIDVDYVIKTNDYNVNSILSNVKSGDVIVFKSGRHFSQLSTQLNNVKIYGETGTILYGLNTGNLTNVSIENVEFESSTELKENIDGLSFINCKFSYGILCEYLIKNLSFDSCNFIDITSTQETAIKLITYENFTITNCVFDRIAYNAMQIGVSASGTCNIYNNTFKNVRSRVIYLISVENLSTCNIENNIFYSHHDNYIDDESLDNSGCKKSSGVYVHTKSSTGTINIGVNTWELIPDYDAKYITPIASYNYNQQLALF